MRKFIIFTIQASLFLALNVSYAYTEDEFETTNSGVETVLETDANADTNTDSPAPSPEPEVVTQKSPEECKTLTLKHLKEQDFFKDLFEGDGDNKMIREIVRSKTQNATRRALLNLLENKRIKQSDSPLSSDELAQKIKTYEGETLSTNLKSLSPQEQSDIFDKFLALSISESEEAFSESYNEIKNYLSDMLLLSESFNSDNSVKILSKMDRQLISIAFLHEKKKTDDSNAKSERMVLFETIKQEMEKIADQAAITAGEVQNLKSEIPEIDAYRKVLANEYVSAVKDLFEDKDGVNKQCKDYFSKYLNENGDVVSCGTQDTPDYDPFILLTKEVDELISQYIEINTNTKDQLFLDDPPATQCKDVLKSKIKIKKLESKTRITVNKEAIEPGVEVFFEIRKRRVHVEKDDKKDEDEEEDEENEESSPDIRKTKKYIFETVRSTEESFDKEVAYDYHVYVKCKNKGSDKASRIKRVKITRCTSQKCVEDSLQQQYNIAPAPQTQPVTPPKTYMPFILSY